MPVLNKNTLFFILGIVLFIGLVGGGLLGLVALPILIAEKRMAAVYGVFLIIGIAAIYINGWIFFSRLKRVNPETYKAAMRNLPYISFVASTTTGPLALTGWLKKISTDEIGKYSPSLRIHAAVGRWLNIAWLIAGVIAAAWGALSLGAA